MAAPTLPMPSTDLAALVVDLDQTLLCTDLLAEQALKLVKTKPLMALLLPFWLLEGKVYLKAKLAGLIQIDPASLPYRQSVLDLLTQAQQQGRTIVLASASHIRLVQEIADYLGLFNEILGSDAINLRGETKRKAIVDLLGSQPYIYIGDAPIDLAVWRGSQELAVAVNPSRSLEHQLRQLPGAVHVIKDRPSYLRLILRQMRVMQWVKNILVFAPMIAAHTLLNSEKWLHAAGAFLAFCMAASAVYVMNDLLDAEADRTHPTKRLRPFASGLLPLVTGFALIPALILACAVPLVWIDAQVSWLIACYFIINIIYTYKIKDVAILDTIILAGFYTLRIWVGGAATQTPVSSWLLSFSMMFFFGLAMVKRYTELLRQHQRATIPSRGYVYADRIPVFSIGLISSLLSIVVLISYLNSQTVQLLYANPQRLWLTTPAMLYWWTRLWLLTHRGGMQDDPIVFALKDRVSWLVLACIVVCFIFSV